MDIRTGDKLKQLNIERTWATELIAAVGQFLDKAQGANCPKLKASCDELITCGLAMITHHTKCIAELRASEVATQQADVRRASLTDMTKMPQQIHTQKPAASVVPGKRSAR